MTRATGVGGRGGSPGWRKHPDAVVSVVSIGIVLLVLALDPPPWALHSLSGSAFVQLERGALLPETGVAGIRYAGQVSLGPPGAMPFGIAYDNRSGEMFVTEDPSYVAVLSGTPPAVIDSIYLGTNTYPEGIAYDGANDTVFVGTYPDSVVVVSGSTHGIVARVNVGFEAETLAYDPTTRDVYAGGGFSNLSDDNVTVINGTTYAVSIILGSPQIAALDPFSIAYDPVTRYLIALGYAGATGWYGVAAFDPTTGKAVWDDAGNFSTPVYSGLAVDSADGSLFLPGSDSVSILNGANGKVISQIPLPRGTDGAAAYNPKSSDVLLGELGGIVQAFQTSTTYLLAQVHVGGSADAIAVDPTTGNAFVANGDTSSVAFLASNDTAVLSISNVGGGPNAVAYDNASGTVYVADSDNVSVVNTTTHRVVGTIAVGANPEGILYDPASNDVFVANTDSNTVSVISAPTNTVEATVAVDPTPWALAWNNATNEVYVTCMNFTGNRALIDVISAGTLQVVTKISLGATAPDGIAYVPSLNEIFVDNSPLVFYPPLNLTVISAATNQIVASFALPSGVAPGQIVFDDVTGDLYVAGAGFAVNGYYPDDIVVNPFNRSVVGTISVGSYPYGIAVEPGTTTLFATAGNNDTVSVIDGATRSVSSFASLLSGTFPEGIAYDPSTNQVFVADWGNDSVSYMVPPEVYTVTFVESGLPSGTRWSVAVNGTTVFSTTSSVTLAEPNGSYSFTVGSVAGYASNVSAGTLKVHGLPVSQPISFKSPGSATVLGLPAAEGYAVLGGIVAAVVVGVAVVARLHRRREAPPDVVMPPSQPEDSIPRVPP